MEIANGLLVLSEKNGFDVMAESDRSLSMFTAAAVGTRILTWMADTAGEKASSDVLFVSSIS